MKYGIKVTNPLSLAVRFVITKDGKPVRRKILKQGEGHLFRLDEPGIYDVETSIMAEHGPNAPWSEVREAGWQFVNHEDVDVEGGKVVPEPKKAEPEAPKIKSLSEIFDEMKKEEVPA